MLDLDAKTTIIVCALIWSGLLLRQLALLSDPRHGTTGLPFAFIALFTAMHFGALVHLVDGYDPFFDPYLASFNFTRETVAVGFEASTFAMIAAVVGFGCAERAMGKTRQMWSRSAMFVAQIDATAKILIAIGFAGIIIDMVARHAELDLAGFQAVLSNARNLVAAGGCGLTLHRLLTGRARSALILIAFFSGLLPLIFLARNGILADSISVSMACFSFYLVARSLVGRNRFASNLGLFMALCVGGFIFSSVYMDFRGSLRADLAAGSRVTALERFSSSINNYDLSSSLGYESLARIDARLDQNIYVGLAIEKLRSFPDMYANGQTIMLALLGWVPRVLWPGKPERGGSGLITTYTDKQTDGVTSFGAGPVFEFYVNFAYYGIFFGFLVLGGLVRLFDILAIRALQASRGPHFAQYFIAGLALLQPLSDLFFVVTSVCSALVLGWALRYLLRSNRPLAAYRT